MCLHISHAQLDAGTVWLTCRAALIPPYSPRGEGLEWRQCVPAGRVSQVLWVGTGAPWQCARSCHCHTEAPGDPEEGQAQGERLLEAIPRACPHALPCAGAGSHQVCAHARHGSCPQLPLSGAFPADSALVQGIVFRGDV